MRIIGGKYRGKKLPIDPKLDLRPTTDFAKEGLFNLLNSRLDIEGISFLDLCAGTGNISYELMSRGAQRGRCVDISQRSHRYRERIISQVDFGDLRSIRSDALRFIRNTTEQYNLIFSDPPFDSDLFPKLIEGVFQHALLKQDGLFVLEHGEEYTFEDNPYFSESRKYGRVHFTFLKDKT